MAEEKECPMYRFCKVVGSKWSLVIVRSLSENETVGFNELLRMIKTNPRTLSLKLKELEKNGLVERRVLEQERPIRVLYSLTEKGKEAINVEKFISRWVSRWNPG